MTRLNITSKGGANREPGSVSKPQRRWLKGCAWGCGGMIMALGLLVGLLLLILSRVPNSYPAPVAILPPPAQGRYSHLGLDGFESPYLGHTGSWDGKGGALWGKSKAPDLDRELEMGLRWTFVPVYWRALEPDGPVELDREVPPAWKALDAFVIEARKRHLNILMQAPCVGGNAEGPPAWAGRREEGKSAPLQMEALAGFAGKLARRYRPGGTLAVAEGWGTNFGVRAWELDNEPEMYRTHWKGQAADYAEFVTLAVARIKAEDPLAQVVGPSLASGKHGLRWLREALDPVAMEGSPQFLAKGTPYSIGPVIDVVSLHNYEGLDSAFGGGSRTIGQVLDDVRSIFEEYEKRSTVFAYARKEEYWHTEGNFDFFGVLSEARRAAWRWQFFTRAFAAGLRKVCVMDASGPERVAVRAYTRELPWPYPMASADAEVRVLNGRVSVYRHPEGSQRGGGQVWILWAQAGTGEALVEVPVANETAAVVRIDGSRSSLRASNGRATLALTGDSKMSEPVMLLDRAGQQ